MAYIEPIDPARRGAVPYRRIKRRTHRGLAVVLALGVMALSAGGLWLGYRLSVDRRPIGEIPLIRADIDPIKVKPGDPGGMDIPNRDRFVLNPTGTMPVERLLPPPETPLPRPVPANNSVPPTIAGAEVPLATPAPIATPAPPPVASEPSPPQMAIVPSPPIGSAIKGYRLQVGAMKTPELAKQAWDRIKRQNSDLVGSLAATIDRADLGNRGVFYRIHAGPIADAAQGERLCVQLRQRGVGCILAKP